MLDTGRGLAMVASVEDDPARSAAGSWVGGRSSADTGSCCTGGGGLLAQLESDSRCRLDLRRIAASDAAAGSLMDMVRREGDREWQCQGTIVAERQQPSGRPTALLGGSGLTGVGEEAHGERQRVWPGVWLGLPDGCTTFQLSGARTHAAHHTTPHTRPHPL